MTSLRRRHFLKGASAGVVAASLPAAHAAAEKADVLILGAGLAGLYAAEFLKDQGFSVRVLEAKSEPGGRTKTVYRDGRHFNVGGSEIGSDCGRFLSAAIRHDVEMIDAHDNGPMAFDLNIGGQMTAVEDWPDSPANRLPEAERNTPPHLLETSLFYSKLPFTGLDDWLKPENAIYDISQLDYLIQTGASEEAMRYIDHFSLSSGVSQTSALGVFRDAARYRMVGFDADNTETSALNSGLASHRVKGGTQKLAMAMAQALGEDVRYGEIVGEIIQDDAGVSVSTLSGGRYRADFAVVTLPLYALRKIFMSPGLPDVQRTAIDTARYAGGAQLHCLVDTAKLTQDGYRAAFFSDTAAEMFSVTPIEGEDLAHGIVWTNGVGADRLAQLPQEDVAPYLMDLMKTLRPATEGALEYLFHYSWSDDPFAGGIRYVYGPGQASTFGKLINKPMGRLVLAGEHARINDLGMEGALESGFSAVLSVLEAAG